MKREKILVSAIVLCVLFIILAFSLNFILKFDIILEKWVEGVRNLSFVNNLADISSVNNFIIVLGIFAVLGIIYLSRTSYKDAIFYLLIIGVGEGIQNILKFLIQRARPLNLIETGFSFPSGHTTSTAIILWPLAFLIWKKNKLLAWTLVIVPFLVGISRVYIGVHWFSDVVGSLLLSGAVVLFGIYFYYKNN